MCNVLGIAQRGNQPTNQKQPDLAIFDFHRGGSSLTLLDAVFTDPTASSYRRNASRSVGSASARAEWRKVEHYRDQAIAAGYRFKAFGIDVFGAWGPSAISLLEELTDYSCSLGMVPLLHQS